MQRERHDHQQLRPGTRVTPRRCSITAWNETRACGQRASSRSTRSARGSATSFPTRTSLDAGFAYDGVRIPFLSTAKGIHRAARRRGRAALSIQRRPRTRMATPRPTRLRVRLPLGWVDQADNVALREADLLRCPRLFRRDPAGVYPARVPLVRGGGRPPLPAHPDRARDDAARRGRASRGRPRTPLPHPRGAGAPAPRRFRGSVLHRVSRPLRRLPASRTAGCSTPPTSSPTGIPAGSRRCKTGSRSARSTTGVRPGDLVGVSPRLRGTGLRAGSSTTRTARCSTCREGFHGRPIELPRIDGERARMRTLLAERFERFRSGVALVRIASPAADNWELSAGLRRPKRGFPDSASTCSGPEGSSLETPETKQLADERFLQEAVTGRTRRAGGTKVALAKAPILKVAGASPSQAPAGRAGTGGVSKVGELPAALLRGRTTRSASSAGWPGARIEDDYTGPPDFTPRSGGPRPAAATCTSRPGRCRRWRNARSEASVSPAGPHPGARSLRGSSRALRNDDVPTPRIELAVTGRAREQLRDAVAAAPPEALRDALAAPRRDLRGAHRARRDPKPGVGLRRTHAQLPRSASASIFST